MSLEEFSRVELLFGRSPIHRLERLSEHLGGQVEIWAKREDCNSGLAYGGNKVRKLEYLAADALAKGYDTVGNILLSRTRGAEFRLDPAGFDIGIRPSWEEALASVEARGGIPYAIP